MTNIVTMAIDNNVIENVDDIRKGIRKKYDINISRSKLVSTILICACKDEELIEKATKEAIKEKNKKGG